MMTQVQYLSPLWLFEPCMLWMNSNPKAYDWTLLEMNPKIVSWMSRSPILEPIKGEWRHEQHQRPKTHKMHAFQVQTQAISSIYQKIIIKVQAHQVLSILNGPKRSKWPNFASLHIWFATSWLSLKFVCLFRVSMFLWILKIHVAFDVLCTCIYYKKKSKKKISRFPNLSQKKTKIFKKKKFFGLGALSP